MPSELISACAVRLSNLRSAMQQQGIDGLLISGENDIYYLTGFIGHDSVLLVTDDRACIISDPRYDEYLNPWRNLPLTEVVMGQRHRLEDSVSQIAKSIGLRTLGFQAEQLTVANRDKLQAALSDLELKSTTGLIAQLRMRKDAIEIAAMERAIEIQQHALTAALQQLQLAMTELEFCAILEYEMKKRGSFKPSFETMVAAGPNSSIIHHVTGTNTIQPGVLLIDWGAKFDGYSSDLTRTLSIGPDGMPPKIREVYDIVLEAQLAAIDACAPGKTCAEIDAVARTIITNAGYGEHFGHGLGHGIGLDTHEPPFFNNLQTDVLLEPNMVMTVEPGIYLPGIGGVRIEDDVLITESGVRVLSNWPKNLDSIMFEIGTTVKPNLTQETCS